MKCSLACLFILLPFCMSAKEGAAPSNLQNKSSLAFIENKGQIIDQFGKHRKDIDFKLEANGMVMFVGKNQLHYQWFSNVKGKSQNAKEATINHKSQITNIEVYRLDVELIGANKNAEVTTVELQDYAENYYLPQCPDGTTAKSYTKVIYKNVYPHIDWVLYTAEGKIKYDFVIGKAGNYKDIQMQYNGATKLELKDGALIATTPFGSITENIPYTYFANNNEEINSNFLLNGNILSFYVGSRTDRHEEEFVIDPGLRWATYYGGSNSEYAMHSAIDTTAKVYLCGITQSTSNIATSGAHQTTIGGTTDAFVVKFDTAGARLWCTYYGGIDNDEFNTVTTDITGNVFLGGTTYSTSSIASTGAFKTSISTAVTSPYDAMLIKLDSNGVRQWGTYFGEGGADQVLTVACDPSGDVYIGGSTNSSGLATSGAFQTTNGEGFIAKFNTSGSRLWCSYYNGDIFSLKHDANGKFYIGGNTTSTTGIATTGAFLTTCPNCSGFSNGFLASFNNNGTRNWGTYYGGITRVFSVICDPLGNIYISGYTGDPTGIATAGSHQPSLALSTSNDGFLAKFTAGGSRLWGTYYGGTDLDDIKALAISESGDVYAMGSTLSTSGISTPNGYQVNYGGGSSLGGDAFLVKFSAFGVRKWATYYGGTALEVNQPAHGLLDRHCSYGKNKIYIGGTTRSSNAIATSGAFQTAYGGGASGDAFIAQFEADTQVYIKQAFIDTVFCAGDTLHLKYGCIQQFRSTNVFTVQLSSSTGSFTSPTVLATLSSNTRFGTIACPIPGNTPAGNGYRVRIIASAPADTSYDDMLDIKINPKVIPVASTNSPLCSGNTLIMNATPSTSGVIWSWTGPGSFTASTQNTNITNAQTTNSGNYIVSANNNGCIRKDTVMVTVNQTPSKPNAASNSPLCSGNTLNLTAITTTGGVSWNWVGPAGFGSTTQNPSIPNIQTNQAGDYIVTATLGPCNSKDTTTVVVNPGPTINTYVNPKDTVCAGSTVTLVALVTNGGSGPSYQWYKNGNPIGGAISASYIASGLNNGDVFYCEFTPGSGTGCNGSINSGSITITILPISNPSVTITASPDTNIWQGLNVTFTATATNCSKPAYQWKLNGNNVSGATSNSWGAATLLDNDMVSCVMTCNDPCPNPKDATSNKLTIHVAAGIDKVNNGKNISIYPNPNNGDFILTSKEKGTLYITNLQGQSVSNYVVETGRTGISLPKNLASGIYIGRFVSTDNKVSMLRIVYKP